MKFALSDDDIEFIGIAAQNGTVLTGDIVRLCEFGKHSKVVIKHLLDVSDQVSSWYVTAFHSFLCEVLSSIESDGVESVAERISWVINNIETAFGSPDEQR